ncbi:hypothetical protein GCM10027418_03210 [Mariniluteicoccus endophyticus]
MFGVITSAVTALGALQLFRDTALAPVGEIGGIVLGSVWAWVLFGGWLGRGGRDVVRAMVLACAGMLSAVVSSTLVDLLARIANRAEGPLLQRAADELMARGSATLVLGVLVGVIGWLTLRRDGIGAAARIVLAVGCSGNMAVIVQQGLGAKNTLSTVVGLVIALAGLGAAAWFFWDALRRGEMRLPSSDGPEAAFPEAPQRHYQLRTGTPSDERTRAYPATGSTAYRPDDERTLYQPTAEAPTQQMPAADPNRTNWSGRWR